MAMKLTAIILTLSAGQFSVGNTARLNRVTEASFPAVTDGGTLLQGALIFGTDGGVPYQHNGSRFVAFGQPTEFGTSAFVAGSKAITFANAFIVVPVCICSDTGGSVLACATGTSTTTDVTFYGTVSNTFNWFCISTR